MTASAPRLADAPPTWLWHHMHGWRRVQEAAPPTTATRPHGDRRYVERMKLDGAWGGHLELQAMSVSLHRNFQIYMPGRPATTVRNRGACGTVRLSYHNGEHYNYVVPIPSKEGKVHKSGAVMSQSQPQSAGREGLLVAVTVALACAALGLQFL